MYRTLIHQTSTPQSSPALLVISCSDARLTVQDSINSWQRRLNFTGSIFEVRCPGGGLAMADRSSAYYQSAFESFKLLESGNHIAEVVLAYHDDCAYFTDKYGASQPAEERRRKLRVMQEAITNVSGWSDTIVVRSLQMSVAGHNHGTAQHSHMPLPLADRERPVYTPPPAMPPQRDRPAYAPLPPRVAVQREAEDCAPPQFPPVTNQRGRMAPQTSPALPSERSTLRAFDRQLEERLLQTAESAQDIITLAEAQAREQGVTPAWRVERRAREFIALLQDEGRESPATVRQLVRAFLQFYAGNTLPRTVLRSLMTELDMELQSPGLRTDAR